MRSSAIATRSVFPLILLLLFAGTAAANTMSYTGSGGPLTDAYFDPSCPINAYGGNVCVGVTLYTIPVADDDIIDSGDAVTVSLTGLQYPYASDLEVSLSLEESLGDVLVSGDLFNQIGGPGADDTQFGDSGAIDSGDYMFNSSFAGDLWATAALLGSSDSIPSGEYFTTTYGSPSNYDLSSMFSGLPVTGIWVLTITDYCPPFSDCASEQYLYQFIPGITSLGLSVGVLSPVVVPEPSTLIPTALAVGLLLLGIRHRSLVGVRRQLTLTASPRNPPPDGAHDLLHIASL
jgi:hypothetical protein